MYVTGLTETVETGPQTFEEENSTYRYLTCSIENWQETHEWHRLRHIT